MDFLLGYDKTQLSLIIPDENVLGVLTPNHVEVGLTGADEVKRALAAPIGTPKLSEIVKPGEKIVIITSDITRPVPTAVILPPVLDEIEAAGCSLEDVCVVFALGNHRPHTEEERKKLLGQDAYGRVKCVDHDRSDCVHLGYTRAGTPVDIFRPVAEADRVIAIGNVEYHYFAGYSGGAKAIMPGVSTHAAIQANHSMMVLDTAVAGRIEGNPLRADIDSVTEFVRLDFIVNVVLDEKKNIIYAAAGHHIKAHRQACAFLDRLYKIPIAEKADIVVVSAGGFPKDINLYQAQKALDNAKNACKPGGTIILAASCKEGLGEEAFERWMTQSESPEFMVEEIQRRFELGGHKAAAIAMVLQNKSIYLVSDMPDSFVSSIFLMPFASLQDAFDDAFKKAGENAKCYVMPYGGSTLPDIVP
ncbi:MAG: nickel-dependent lactate racemase [Christensenellales bacterium]|jgi:nickel-dependent lactate racemase